MKWGLAEQDRDVPPLILLKYIYFPMYSLEPRLYGSGEEKSKTQ